MSKTLTTLRRLAEIAPAGGDLTPMEELQGRDLLLKGLDNTETQFGDGFFLHLEDPATGETFECLTSAVVVVKQLNKLQEAGDPFEDLLVRFEKQGRCWIIT